MPSTTKPPLFDLENGVLPYRTALGLEAMDDTSVSGCLPTRPTDVSSPTNQPSLSWMMRFPKLALRFECVT